MSSRSGAGSRAPKRRLPREGARTGEVPAHPLSAIVTLSRGAARGHVTSPRGRALPGDRHVPLRDGAAARPRRPSPSRKLTLPLVACLANQLSRRVPATMRACFQTISGGGPALPSRWAGSGRRLVFGAVTQHGSGRFWLPVGARRCQSARWARARCDAEERRARVRGGCGGRVAPALQVGFAVRAALCHRVRPWRPRGRCTQ